MALRIEDGIHPLNDSQLKAILQEVLGSPLLHVSVEVTSHHHRRISSLLADDVQHVLGPRVAHAFVASSPIAAGYAPVGVEDPECSPCVSVSKLDIGDVSGPPLALRLQISLKNACT